MSVPIGYYIRKIWREVRNARVYWLHNKIIFLHIYIFMFSLFSYFYFIMKSFQLNYSALAITFRK